jgi:hypothetical protein
LRTNFRIGHTLFKDAAYPRSELLFHVKRHSEHGGNHAHGNVLGVIACRIGNTLIDNFVNERVAQGLRYWFILRH